MKTNKQIKEKIEESGYFFHPGGPLHGEIGVHRTRGIWLNVESPIYNIFIATSWAEAYEDYYWRFLGRTYKEV